MIRYFYVYKITNKINGKIYIGKSNSDVDRWHQHQLISAGGKEKYPNTFYAIHAAIKKYGKDNFIYEIIENEKSEEMAFKLESLYISKYKNFGIKLYNLTTGGEGASGRIVNQITKEKMRQSHLGYCPTTKTREKLSSIQNGANNSFYGKKHKEKSKILIGIKSKGRLSGEKSPHAKLTSENVNDILYSDLSVKDLATKYNVNRSTIYAILTGKIWKHL